MHKRKRIQTHTHTPSGSELRRMNLKLYTIQLNWNVYFSLVRRRKFFSSTYMNSSRIRMYRYSLSSFRLIFQIMWRQLLSRRHNTRALSLTIQFERATAHSRQIFLSLFKNFVFSFRVLFFRSFLLSNKQKKKKESPVVKTQIVK